MVQLADTVAYVVHKHHRGNPHFRGGSSPSGPGSTRISPRRPSCRPWRVRRRSCATLAGGGGRVKGEWGGRWEGGEARRGYGSEVGGSVEYANPRLGLALAGRGRYLLGHESQGVRAWGASVAVRYDPEGDGQGVWIGVEPQWGTPASGVDSLWGRAPSGAGGEPALRLGVTAGYRRDDALDVSVTVERDRTHAPSSLGMALRTRMRW